MQAPVKDKDGNVIGSYYVAGYGDVVQLPPFESKSGRFKDTHTPPHFRYPATTEDLGRFATNFFSECQAIMREKNARYAGSYDPFKNFRMCGDYGIAVRLTDKVCRLVTLTHPTNTVDGADESIEDTCHDIANYAMLLAGLRSNERGL